MVVVMEERASEEQIQRVVAQLVEMGIDVHRSTGALADRASARSAASGKGDPRLLEVLDGVHEVLRITEPYKLASRTFKPEDTVITIGDVRIGGDEVIVMAGPCSAETEEQVDAHGGGGRSAPAPRCCAAAPSSRAARRTASRGSARRACSMLRAGADAHDLKLVTEVMDISQIELIDSYADIFQVGARNMQNFTLLRELGPIAQAGAAQARHLGDDRGVAAVGRVHAGRRQHEGDPLRARHPHLRDATPATRSTSRRSRS